jgi:hypothetical protein
MKCAIQAGVGINYQTRTTTALGYSETLYVITISSAPKLIHRRKSVRVPALAGVPASEIRSWPRAFDGRQISRSSRRRWRRSIGGCGRLDQLDKLKDFGGDPGRIRTCDLQLRRRALPHFSTVLSIA